jgi:predicted AAA+ superfamily ATPase
VIKRLLEPILAERLDEVPCVALLGPRQVGKTTLALAIGESRPSQYLDLESPSDLAKLEEAELYLKGHADKLVIVDEIQRRPDLFPILRGLIDRARRRGPAAGKFLLLGSASGDLLRQSGESLAGRISYLEMTPLRLSETGSTHLEQLWQRGGFPESYVAKTAAASVRWRRDFILTSLERDLPRFGTRIPIETQRRLWTMLAHRHGELHNAATLAQALDLDGKTIARYVDLLVDLMLVRRLSPWHANLGKRLVKSPKLYVRDSGLLHALLGITDQEALLGHPVLGASWEGWVVEQIASAIPKAAELSFFRTAAGAEVDLVIDFADSQRWVVEIKHTTRPSLSRGFRSGVADLAPTQRWFVYRGEESFSLGHETTALSVAEIVSRLAR